MLVNSDQFYHVMYQNNYKLGKEIYFLDLKLILSTLTNALVSDQILPCWSFQLYFIFSGSARVLESLVWLWKRISWPHLPILWYIAWPNYKTKFLFQMFQNIWRAFKIACAFGLFLLILKCFKRLRVYIT